MTDQLDNKSLKDALDKAAIALLEDRYGHIVDGTRAIAEFGGEDAPPAVAKPDVFNAVVNWVRVRNKLEPEDDDGNELEGMINAVNKRGKR